MGAWKEMKRMKNAWQRRAAYIHPHPPDRKAILLYIYYLIHKVLEKHKSTTLFIPVLEDSMLKKYQEEGAHALPS